MNDAEILRGLKKFDTEFCKSYFLTNSVHFPQQLCDAEILHLSQVAGKRLMQKFCKFHFPLNSILLLTTIVWCRNSASQPNGLKKSDTEILQMLFSDKFYTSSTTTAWCRNSASRPNGLKTFYAEILQIWFSARFDTFSTTVVWRRISANLTFC